MAAAGEQHQQVGGASEPFQSLPRAALSHLRGILRRKFLLTKPMHMAAEDAGVCQLHCISEDPLSSGHGVSSGECERSSGPVEQPLRSQGLSWN